MALDGAKWRRPTGRGATLRLLAIAGAAVLVLYHFTNIPLLFGIRRIRGIVLTEVDAQRLPQCHQVPAASLAQLQRAKEARIHTYLQGELVSQSLNEFTTVCIIVAIPQAQPEIGFFKDEPVPGFGPDNVHLYLNSSKVRVTTPPLLPFPGQPALREELAHGAVLYYAEITLNEAGVYQIAAEQEFRNWRWAKQWWNIKKDAAVGFPSGFIAPLLETEDLTAKIMAINAVVNDGLLVPNDIDPANMHPPAITIGRASAYGSPNVLINQKNCTSLDDFDASKGRWYKAEDHDLLPAQADEWGFVWEPDHCVLDHFTDYDVADCLEGKSIHVFGDSNSRRLSRALMSGGYWCHDPEARCQKEDWGDDVLKIVWDDENQTLQQIMEKPEHNSQFELNDRIPFDWGRNTKLNFNFLESVVLSPGRWLSNFYPNESYVVGPPGEAVPFEPWQLAGGAVPRAPPDLGHADLVVFGVGAWDEAFDWTFDNFETTLPFVRDALVKSYPPEVKLMLRVGQGVCCRREFKEDLRRFSGQRNRAFGDIQRKIFDIQGGTALGGRMQVLDASGMCGRPEVVNDYGPVSSNHQRAAHVRMETQILLNKVCRRDARGKAVWR